MKEVLWRRYEKFFRRLHKNIGHIHFLTECSEKNINPKFTWIPVQTVKQLNLNPSQIKTHRRKQLNKTLQDEIEKRENLKFELNHILSILSSLIHNNNLDYLISKIKKKNFQIRKK